MNRIGKVFYNGLLANKMIRTSDTTIVDLPYGAKIAHKLCGADRFSATSSKGNNNDG